MRARTAVVLGSVLVGGLCAACGPSVAHTNIGVGSSTPTTSSSSISDSPASANADGTWTGGTQCPAGSKDPAVVRLGAIAATAPTSLLPADFEAVAAVRCEVVLKTVAGDGIWDVALAQRATIDLDSLVSALRQPSSSAPTDAGFACAAVGVVLPNFALVDAHGRIVRPSLPHSQCGSPLVPALDALNALRWATETQQRLSQVETPAEVGTGCPNAYKDVFDFRAAPAATPWVEAHGAASLKPTTVCEYRVSQVSAAGGIAVGMFDHGLKLSSAQQRAVAAAFADSSVSAAEPCELQASKFALLTVGGSNLAVELDGCLRTSYPDFSFAQTPAAVLAALRAAGVA